MAQIGRKRASAQAVPQSQASTVVIERLVEPCILLLLKSSAACGYELFQRIRLDCLYANVDLPTVYRTLRRLETQMMITPSTRVGPRQKQLYELTDDGMRYLDRWMASLRDSTHTTARLIAQYERRQFSLAEAEDSIITTLPDHSGAQEETQQMYKVVVQHNVAGHEEHLIAQLRGLLRQFGPGELDLVVIAHGDGIGLVTDPTYQDAVMALVNDGVSFLGCSVTLQRQQMTAENLVPGAAATPGALAEIVRRQHDGYAYLRPF